MAEATAEDLAARVRNALRDASVPPWLPGLTADLADAAWHKLDRDLDLNRDSYGTARVLCGHPKGIRQVVASFDTPSAGGAGRDPIPVELLPEDLVRPLTGPDMRLFDAEEILGNGISGRVEEALAILSSVPTVLPTVCTLVRALHLIDPGDDEVDVSFSEPSLPFSAFVSVPGPSAVASGLRLAEALLHESMHLQLTIIEAVVPLVMSSETTYFSPWRNEYRTTQGVLHALYVFRVIDAFLAASSFATAPARRHARNRRATISRQVSEVRDFRASPDLTADGVAFVTRLLG